MYPYKRIPAHKGIVTEIEGRYFSPRLNKIIPYYLVMPAVLEEGQKVPVVYFLHGRNGTRHMFRDLGGPGVLERFLGTNRAPFAVVGLTGSYSANQKNFNTYWVDNAKDPKQAWATIILKEMIPWIEKEHNIGGAPSQRAIAGISMGAHGAYQLALNSPGTFQCVAGHSLVVRDYQSMTSEFPGLFGNPSQFAKRDPLSLLKNTKKGSKPFQHAWADIGGADDPRFLKWASAVGAELTRLGYSQASGDKIDVGVEFPQGDHTYVYWTRRLPQYLGWYGRCFTEKRPVPPPRKP